MEKNIFVKLKESLYFYPVFKVHSHIFYTFRIFEFTSFFYVIKSVNLKLLLYSDVSL